MTDFRFEPFFDYDQLTDEMVDHFHDALTRNIEAQEAFHKEKNRENLKAVLESHSLITGCAEAIRETIWTEPSTIHVVGPCVEEPHDDHDCLMQVQRCTRCGSVLLAWCEHMPYPKESIDWWEEGTVVSKFQAHGMMRIASVGDRRLERYEVMCVDISFMADGGNDET